jgi:hypothetical protein
MHSTRSSEIVRIVAIAIGITSILVSVSTLALDKGLSYRIGPDDYTRYLWVDRLSVIAPLVAIASIITSIVARQRLWIVLSFVSLISPFMFLSVVHSGPNPQAWCCNNLREIDAAKEQLAEEAGLTNGTIVTTSQISKYIDGGFDSLKCVEHGSYIIGPIGMDSRCTFHGSESEMQAEWKKEMDQSTQ